MSMVRRVSNVGTGDCPVPSVIVPRKEASGYPRPSSSSAFHHGNSMMPGMNNTPRNAHQHMKIDDMTLRDFGPMGEYEPNSLDMGSRFMHGQGQAMGSSMDRLMDFPNQMFIPPIRRVYPRNLPHPSMNQQPHGSPYSNVLMDDYTIDPYAHKIPVHDSERFRTMIRSNSGRPGAEDMNSSMMVPSSNGLSNGKRKSRRPSTTSFPTKLYKILSEPQYQDCIAWLPHGRAWRVLKPKILEDEIIPKYFRSDRLASFMRQVNGWGFKRITEGPDLNAYYHEMFLRGLPHVCNKMRRPVKGESGLSRDLGQHPDFYKISMFAPLPEVNAKPPGDNAAEFDTEVESTPMTSKKETITIEKSPGVVSSDGATTQGDDLTPLSSPKGANQQDISPEKIEFSSAMEDPSADGGILITGASLESPPNSPQTDRSISRNTPNAYFDSADFHRTPSGNSLSSWNDHNEVDIMWSGASVGSPSSGNGHWHQTEQFSGLFNNGFGQVTPPGGPPHLASAALRYRARPDHIRVPFDDMGMVHEGGVDDSTLSAADLCYLTQQNRILLSHSKVPSDARE
jgi:HSF-type DNA-binding